MYFDSSGFLFRDILIFRYLVQLRKHQLAGGSRCLCSCLCLRLVGLIKTLILLKVLSGLFLLCWDAKKVVSLCLVNNF